MDILEEIRASICSFRTRALTSLKESETAKKCFTYVGPTLSYAKYIQDATERTLDATNTANATDQEDAYQDYLEEFI